MDIFFHLLFLFLFLFLLLRLFLCWTFLDYCFMLFNFILFSPTFANFRQYLLSFFLFLVITYCSIFVIQLVITLCPPLSSKKKRNESALLVQYTLVMMCTLQSCSQRENKNCFLQI